MYRVLLLRRFFPDKRILVLTHNRPLIRDLQAKYEMLSKGDTGVEWRTFLSWCLSQWPNRAEDAQPIGKQGRRELIAEVWAKHFADTAVTQGMLESELDWFKDRTITKRSEYLSADRTGRDFVDMLLIATMSRIDGRSLSAAIRATFGARSSHALPGQLPDPPSNWAASFRRSAEDLELSWHDLPAATQAAQAFVNPILKGAIAKVWDPETWSWE